jgi:hypothetical protein
MGHLSKQNNSQQKIISPTKRIPAFDVALCHRQKKYAPCDFPATFVFALSSTWRRRCSPISLADPLSPPVRLQKYFLEPVSPAAYSKINSVATRY